MPTHFLRRLAKRGCVGASVIVGAVLFGAAPGAAKTISGVCPDGSIFIVQRLSAVPCPLAKQVNPNEIPPLNPELLPRPYGWEQFQGQQDPNNPYNVVDSAPSLQLLGGPRDSGPRDMAPGPKTREPEPIAQEFDFPSPSSSRSEAPRMQTARANPPSAFAAASEAMNDVNLVLAEQDLRDLALIVELSQRQSPATFQPLDEADSKKIKEASGLTLRFAYSASFEPRLRAHFQERGGLPPGNVLLFSVVATDTQAFYGNLTFVQAGMVYHPNRDEPRDLGVLRSHLGLLREGETLLGYTRLPEGMDVTREIDIYWNDRLVNAVLKPT